MTAPTTESSSNCRW
uniref:Uncharacterized protein n=1 Tax=Arundo donax TaxID=35708 RepID=A0A0A9FYE2_ARUDO